MAVSNPKSAETLKAASAGDPALAIRSTSETGNTAMTGFLKPMSGGDPTLLKSSTSETENDKELKKDYESGTYGRNALHLAAVAGETELCKFLVENLKFDVNLKNEQGNTPLILAVMKQHQPTAEYLIENGAGIVCRNRNDFTALHYATLKGQTKMLQLLLSKGEEVKPVLNSDPDPESATELACTPLMLSVLFKSYDCLELLLEAGSDPNHSSIGKIPLILAVCERDIRIIEQLLKAGANPNVVDNNGVTPIERAALSGNVDVVKVLFPSTSPISSIPDWSVDGIMKQVNSVEQRGISTKYDFQVSKAKGQQALEEKDYEEAIFWYSRANLEDRTDETVLSDRSLCWEMLKHGDIALADAKVCVALKPDWATAHHRMGAAYILLKEYSKALEAFSKALELASNDEDIEKAQSGKLQAEFGLRVSEYLKSFQT